MIIKIITGEIAYNLINNKKSMNTKEFAELVNNREYREVLKEGDEDKLIENNLVMITGYSDDNIEFSGTISDEVGAYEKTNVFISNGKRLVTGKEEFTDILELSEFNNHVKEVLKSSYGKYLESCIEISGEFDTKGYSWYINMENNQDQEYSYFDVLEDGDKHTRGIILKLK